MFSATNYSAIVLYSDRSERIHAKKSACLILPYLLYVMISCYAFIDISEDVV